MASAHGTVPGARKHRSLLVRLLCAGLGAVFVALGVIGLFLPVLPTTPFLLLAAACFARSSSRIYHWLMRHRTFGPLLREWNQHRAIPYRAKRMALVMIALSFTLSIVLFIPYWQGRLAMGLGGIVLFVWIARLPSRDAPTHSIGQMRGRSLVAGDEIHADTGEDHPQRHGPHAQDLPQAAQKEQQHQ